MQEIASPTTHPTVSFFDRPDVQLTELPAAGGIPLGIEAVCNPRLSIGGAYGAWGKAYDNESLVDALARRGQAALAEGDRLNLAELGFLSRHHVPPLSDEEHLELEVEAGTQLVIAAAHANGWEPAEVDALLVGMTAPASDDYTLRVARAAGIRESALKVSVHKACDSSVAALNLALNPQLPGWPAGASLAQRLAGKKVLLGGIEGLSRAMGMGHDVQAQQLFGTGAGLIGVIPGQTMRFLAGGVREAFDEEGALQVRMRYPHSGRRSSGQSMIEVSQPAVNHIRVAGLMHEPADKGEAVVMAGPMAMVKLFVRTGVSVVREVYDSYRQRMAAQGSGKDIAVAIVHHANFKINQLKERNLQKEGVRMRMPWLLSDFGNVCSASNMIAFLREVQSLHPGDHVLFDGFGAGTHYDVVAVEMRA